VGIDVGGTFTDLAAVDPDGVLQARKVLSTPGDQSAGVEGALAALGVGPAEITRVVHGTTVVTNLLLERAGARVVLCATAGATDLLELRRQERASLYDLAAHHPPPLVAPGDVIAVPERVTPDGVERALSEREARAVARAAAERAPDIVAVSLLHAYAAPEHEHSLLRAFADTAPRLDVVLSTDVLPQIREYERVATTVAEAYARPAVARYLRRLGERLERGGYPAPSVMTSGGGLRGAADAAATAAALALSGPAGGVVGAAFAARAAGFDRALTIDIGGTSADVGLVLGGEPLVEAGGVVAGVPIALPRVLVETVSAGGGSLLWVDDGGALRVGPRSAGAEPGPAAFGRGGTGATVTDSHVVLGTIREQRMSGGVRVDAAAAERAIAAVGRQLGVAPARVAAAVAAADAEMGRALRRVSVERGVDPRSCVLVAFGGGGPLHACGLAEQLGMRRVLVPPHAGVLSAVGLALGAERREALGSVMRPAAELDAAAVGGLADQLRRRAAGPADELRWWARARYRGQGHELEVPFAPGDDGAVIAGRFAALHQERFSFTLERPVDVVSARHSASGAPRVARFARQGENDWRADTLLDRGGTLEATVRGRRTITLPDATLLVADGWTARALPTGGWLVERDA